MTDEAYLRQALKLAEQSKEPMPCACILVQNGKVIAAEYNSQHADEIAVHHAEVKVVYQANRKTGSRKLTGAVAYCSCEPCAMCLTALSYAKVARIVFAKRMIDLFPDDPQSRLNPEEFAAGLNFVPKIEHLIV